MKKKGNFAKNIIKSLRQALEGARGERELKSTYVTKKDCNKLQEYIKNPPEPNEKLKKAMKKHEDLQKKS